MVGSVLFLCEFPDIFNPCAVSIYIFDILFSENEEISALRLQVDLMFYFEKDFMSFVFGIA